MKINYVKIQTNLLAHKNVIFERPFPKMDEIEFGYKVNIGSSARDEALNQLLKFLGKKRTLYFSPKNFFICHITEVCSKLISFLRSPSFETKLLF